MSSRFGKRVQRLIDRVRGKARYSDPADRFSARPDDPRRLRDAAGTLAQIFYTHEGRIAHKWDHYLPIYERHFRARPASGQPVRLLEIGVSRGGSLQLWRKYFGDSARIVGIDIDPDCAGRVDPGTEVIVGDQSDPHCLSAAVERLGGGVDIVVDDGSHLGRHQIATFDYLFPRLSDHGLYYCEDVFGAYWPEYEGGYRREGTFIEYGKTLVDRLNAWFLEEPLKSEFLDFARATHGIFFYPGIIVIEKRPMREPFHVQIGEGA
ncbi:MAG TPA: class I SAM-dependent methyltransferase [Chthonomonadaceae bacterium]|nr:class I SAM-dependent methyltransferase [Chthonomonadaceae bacterium]